MFNDEKGMATVDLLFATFLAIIIFGVFVASVDSSMDKADLSDFGHMRMVGEKVVASIDKVYTNGPGYSVNVTITEVMNASYNIIVNENGVVTVKYGSNKVDLQTVPKTNIQSTTLDSGKTYSINNNDGAITIIET